MIDVFVPYFALGVVAAVNGTVFYRRYLANVNGRAIRRVAGVARRSIAEAREGELVRIVGRVEGVGAAFQAPVSDRFCIAYQVVSAVEEWLGFTWPQTDERTLELIVRDPSGAARIATGGGALALVLERKWTFGRNKRATRRVDDYLTRQGRSREKLLSYRWTRVQEGVLVDGDEVAVLGIARWEPHADGIAAGYREAPRRLVLEQWIVTNDPRARR